MGPVAKLKKLGCRVMSRENTPGAKKWWLIRPDTVSKELIVATVGAKFDGYYEYEGDDFRLEFQNALTVFIAKPNKTQAGREYQMGIDC